MVRGREQTVKKDTQREGEDEGNNHFSVFDNPCLCFFLRQARRWPDRCPTIKDIQKQVGCKKIDGKLCKMWNVPGHSETQELWNKVICQQEASMWDFMYEETE